MIQVLLMVMIILTGNYNFFNWLTIALCFSLLDDNHLNFWSGKRENTKTGEFCYVCHGNVLSCRSSVCDTVCQYSTLSVHSFIQTISIALLQVHFYSEAVQTQHGYCAGVSHRTQQPVLVKELAQGPNLRPKSEF